MNVKDIRRENTRQLAQTVGGITALGTRLGKTQAQISHLIGKRPLKNIGDRLALQIERSFNKPYGWLDKLHSDIHYNNEEVSANIENAEDNKVHWLPLIRWDQILQFAGKDRESMPANLDKLSTQLDVSVNSFSVHVQDESTKKLAGIQIDRDAVFIVDGRVPPQEQSLVLVFNDDRSQVRLQKHQTELSMNTAKYKLDPHRVIGVIRQIIITM